MTKSLKGSSSVRFRVKRLLLEIGMVDLSVESNYSNVTSRIGGHWSAFITSN